MHVHATHMYVHARHVYVRKQVRLFTFHLDTVLLNQSLQVSVGP